MAALLAESVYWCKIGFKHGEVPLLLMGKQLKALELFKNDNYSYLVDDIINLYDLKNTDILLLETSSNFGCANKLKISFGYYKSFSGSLAMLKDIADELPLATLEVFWDCKMFFVHAVNKNT